PPIGDVKFAYNAIINLFINTWMDGGLIYIKNYGRLYPLWKPGGRPVRNPRTGEGKAMHDVVNIRVATRTSNGTRKCTHRLTQAGMVDALKKHGFTKETASLYVGAILHMLRLTQNGKYRIELRGFAVFEAVYRGEVARHNPATGEKVVIGPHYAPKITVSKKQVRRITNAFKQRKLAHHNS
ncbi:HU family DNA-binding protein, partial [Photobacterium halotolerans]|uniref:HU family DNA-binding protein n=1 Tax=Photobacterium halotolerans TaxID=265726 RepID=UPI000560B00E